jgi:hypothetical protein
MMIEIRRLAALDLTFLGPKIILPEFALGVLGPPALGVLTLLKSRSTPWMLFGAYLVALGANYVPLLLHAISITRRGTAREEIADEGGDQAWLFRRYRRQSLLLLLPLVVPIVALVQERRRKSNASRPRGLS